MRKSLLLALSLLGLWDATYLWWSYASPSHPLVCLGTGCDIVRASSYAHLWGLPLPVYGAAMYAALTLLLLAEPLLATGAVGAARYAVVAISGAGFVASLGLTGIEAFVLHAWCAWCVVSAVTVTLIFALALWDLKISTAAPEARATIGILRGYFAILLIALAVGTPAFALLTRHGELPPPPPISPALAEHLVRQDSHAAGTPQAPLTVVEFGDFECPACGQAEPVMKQIRQKYGDRIQFVFRQFPLSSIHQHAEEAAEASECAAEQGKFWEAVTKLYDHQGDLSRLALDRYAAELGLDPSRFRQCLTSGAAAARIRRDVDDAHALGVHATPTFYVGEQVIQGPVQLDDFSKLVDQELARGGSKATQAAPAGGATPSQSTGTTAEGNGGRAPVFGNPGNAFGQSSEMACDENEAKKRQPTQIRTPSALDYFKNASKSVFVDVREARDFHQGRISGAINIPAAEIEKRWKDLPRDKTVIFYESGLSSGDVCAASRAAGRVLLTHGLPFERVKVYQDGLNAWEKAGLPVSR